MPAAVNVVDRISIPLSADARVLVCSDLHLGQHATAASRLIQDDLVERLSRWDGPGAIVLNGDTFDLWGEPCATVEVALDAHPELTGALASFGRAPDRRVVVVAGNHDAQIAWDGVSAPTLARRWVATCVPSVDLVFDAPAGQRVVRCEHGHAYDPANVLANPRDPLDSSSGRHLVRQAPPKVRRAPLLSDVDALADPQRAGQLLASRLVYRHLGRRAWWLLLPLLLAVLLRTPLVLRLLPASRALHHPQRWLVIAGIGLAIDVALLVVLAVLIARSVYTAMANDRLGPRGPRLNGPPRAAAAALCADGLAGLITGHTHEPELTAVPGGFYGNSGCGARCVVARPGRLFLPPVFAAVLRRSWIELDVDHDVRVSLTVSEQDAGETTRLERLAARRGPRVPTSAQVVATLPGQAGWPLRHDVLDRRAAYERARRWAARIVGLAAAFSVLSALRAPFAGRLGDLFEVLPVEVPQAAAAGVVFGGAALALVVRGLRRGTRLAWVAAVGLLFTTAALHLLKGIDVEQAVLITTVAIWLLRHRAAFPIRPSRRHLRLAAAVALGGVLTVVAVSAVLIIVAGSEARPGETARAVAGRLVGNRAVPLPSTAPFLTPALFAAGLGLLLVTGSLIIKTPRHAQPSPVDHRADLARARRIVAAHGNDTLAYFALRDDKSWFFTNDCVVAYDVRAGVCIVSPDPIGPPEQWLDAWADFLIFADRHGWPVSVLGAGSRWLPIYEAAGLRTVYLGDEAIVDCTGFTLDGPAMKGLRSGHRRVRRAGYTVQFYDPATMPQALADELRQLMTDSRQGNTERGFSMTLSRLFDPADTGLLLTVAHGPDGHAAGFCQWVPATDIGGWSLDLMRRSTQQKLPNGLTDYIVIETINHLRARGDWGLSLNFAVMRAILARERGQGTLSGIQRRVLHLLAGSTQIESLWRYNDKYRPYWRPRYVVLSNVRDAPIQALAMAHLEGVVDIPTLGGALPQQKPPPDKVPLAC